MWATLIVTDCIHKIKKKKIAMPHGAYIYCMRCTAYTTDRGSGYEGDEAWVEDVWEGKGTVENRKQ